MNLIKILLKLHREIVRRGGVKSPQQRRIESFLHDSRFSADDILGRIDQMHARCDSLDSTEDQTTKYCLAEAAKKHDQHMTTYNSCPDRLAEELNFPLDQVKLLTAHALALKLFALRIRLLDQENPPTERNYSHYLTVLQAMIHSNLDNKTVFQRLAVSGREEFDRVYVTKPVDALRNVSISCASSAATIEILWKVKGHD